MSASLSLDEAKAALATHYKEGFRALCRELQKHEDWATISDTIDNLIAKYLPIGDRAYLPVKSVPISPPAEQHPSLTEEPVFLSPPLLKTTLDAILVTEKSNEELSARVGEMEAQLENLREQVNSIKGGTHKRKLEEEEAPAMKKLKA